MPLYTVECNKCAKQRDVALPLAEHGNWPSCHGKMRQVFKPLQVVKDIEPYQAVATDIATGKPPQIRSRREHKEFLRRNNYREVGNEPMKERKIIDVPDSHRDVKRTLDQFRSEGRWK